MTTAAIIAFLTTFFSVAVKVVGMPDQIKSNHRRKSTDGLSNWFLITTLLSYGLWVVHGMQVHDMSLVIGQGLGVVVTTVIVIQMAVYRKNSQNVKHSRPIILWYAAMLQRGSNRAAAATRHKAQPIDYSETDEIKD